MLPRNVGAVVHRVDGWAHAAEAAPAAPAGLLVLIDPPFERGDDCAQAAALMAQVLQRNAGAVVALWTPLKDLATFDALVGDMEDAAQGRGLLAAELRLRPLTDPMRLNGCAMIISNPPPGLDDYSAQVVEWLAKALGEEGASGRVTRL